MFTLMQMRMLRFYVSIAIIALSFLSFPLQGGAKELTSSKICGKCHKDIFETWKNSLHARSLSDPIFQVAYMDAYFQSRGEAKKHCPTCHAPAVRTNKDFDLYTPIANEGVTCDFCHSVESVHLDVGGNHIELDEANRKHGPLSHPQETDAHESLPSSLHRSALFCAGCHELINKNNVKVMSTYSEWKKGPYPKEGKVCQDCHMPLVTGDASVETAGNRNEKHRINTHDIAGGHSVKQLKKALKIEVKSMKRQADNSVLVQVGVTNVGSGHRVPTGLPSRKVQLKVSLYQGDTLRGVQSREYRKELLNENGELLSRDADIMSNSLAFSVGFDNRIFPKETRSESFRFRLPPSTKPLKVKAELSYLYSPLLVNEESIVIPLATASRQEK